MLKISKILLFTVILSFGCSVIIAQETQTLGSLEVSGRVKIGKKSVKLKRKRFYLFSGGLKENKALIDELKVSEPISRDCYYSQIKASPQFMCWLKEEDCESPYCRAITQEDIGYVPEFQRAYQKGLRQFGRRRSTIARTWLTTNLSPRLRDGFYQRQKFLLSNLLSYAYPIQSAMTDTVSVKAIFIDIPLNLVNDKGKAKKSDTLLISNLLPVEVGDKSYLWACEVKIRADKTAKLSLKIPKGKKPIRGCEIIIKDLPVCKTESCTK